MKAHCSQMDIYLTGSRKTVKRTIYTRDGRFYIKWYGQYIEVMNRFGADTISAGWHTVLDY